MGRLVLAIGLGLIAVGVGRMWWAQTQLHGYQAGDTLGVNMVKSDFESGRGWLVWGAVITGIGFPRGKRGPGLEGELPFAQVRRVRVMQDG